MFNKGLQEAGIRRKEARSIGIAVDHRRRNRSNESLELNVQRLKAYKAKLIVFPRKAGKPKKGDSEAAEVASAVQFRGPLFPVEQVAAAPEAREITAEEKKVNAYMKLRYARSAARTLGAREKRARDKAEEEANKVRTIHAFNRQTSLISILMFIEEINLFKSRATINVNDIVNSDLGTILLFCKINWQFFDEIWMYQKKEAE